MRIHTLATASGTVCVQESSTTLRSAPSPLPPLVLLHGIGSTARSWSPQMSVWATTRRVFAWNAPGYAGSTLPDQPGPGVQGYADILAATMDALDLENAVLVASSWGSLVAMALAATQPARVTRLVLTGPTAGAGHLTHTGREQLYTQRSQRAQQLGVSAMLVQDAARLVAPGAGTQVMEELEAGRNGVSLPGYLAALRMLCDTDGSAWMARVHQPVLLIAGEQDLIAPPADHAARLAALAPDARLILLPGCAHLPHVEQASIFRNKVQAFLFP